MKTDSFSQLVHNYERDGVVRVSSFLKADEVAAVRAELDRYVRDDLASKPLDARTLDRRDVQEDVLAAGFRGDEAVAFGLVEPFHGAVGHRESP